MELHIETEIDDGMVILRPLDAQDAQLHLVGEDEEQARWLGDGRRSTLDTVQAFIARMQLARRDGHPIWNFGIWEMGTYVLLGNIEANATPGFPGLGPGEANLSYVIFPPYRRKGIATRAVALMCKFLSEQGIQRAVIQVHPGNLASVAVAERSGFQYADSSGTPDAPMLRFVRTL